MNRIPHIYQAAAEPRVVHAFGDQVEFYLIGDETGGEFVHGKITVAPGGGPPPHVHAREDEWFFVISGRASFLVNGEWTEVRPGTRVYCPRDHVHTFQNIGTTPLELLVTASPSGFEHFFARCAEEFHKAGGPDHARIVEIAGEFGISFVQPAL